MKYSVFNQSIFMTHPVEDNESLDSNQIHFCFAKSFWCDYVYVFKIKQTQLAAGENFGNFFAFFDSGEVIWQ